MRDEGQRPRKNRGTSRKSSHIDVRIGARIRQRRVALGLTLQELGSRVGVSFQQLQKYEAGDSRIPVSRLHDIAQVLAVPITWFFVPELATTGSNAEAPQETSLQRQADRLVSLFIAIDDPRARQAIMQLVTLLAELSGKSTIPRP
jgi:transcriptional regulator with XRE-family HTH domain